MRKKIRCLSTRIACMTIVLAFCGGLAQGADKKGRPEISTADRAMAVIEVQNAFSKHAFYHQVGQHCAEMEDVWVKEGGEYSKTAKWTTMGNVYMGIPLLKDYYCTYKEKNRKKTLENLSKTYPAVKNIPENLGAGDEYVMHTQSCPVIEIAGDGKTAKGIWYSIGQSVRGTVDSTGKATISTSWMWEKYAVDFAKEDGKWKIWHIENVMDQGPVESGSGGQMGAGGPPGGAQMGAGGPPGGAQMGAGGPPGGGQGASMPQGRAFEQGDMMGAGMPKPTMKDTDPPVAWSPTVAPKIDPKFPEPYYTFSETFSY